MRKCVIAIVVTIGAALASAAPSFARTVHLKAGPFPPIPVDVGLIENEANQPGCVVSPVGLCGDGAMLPFGGATEWVEFGGGPCGARCNIRAITVAQGQLVMLELFKPTACPGACNDQSNGTLYDAVEGDQSTGIFQDADGVLRGTVKSAGGLRRIRLLGAITFARPLATRIRPR